MAGQSIAEDAGIKDPDLIAYYDKMYVDKNPEQAIKAIQNKEASKKKTLLALVELEKVEAARIARIITENAPGETS